MVFPNDFFAVNGWHKKTGDYTFFVYAGFVISDPVHGGVVIKEANDSLLLKTFLGPKGCGKLKIVAEQDLLFTLQNEEDQNFYFNAQTQQFVDKSGKAVSVTVTSAVAPEGKTGYPAP